MAKKLFTPITYNEGDFVSFRYVSATAQKTGCFCKVKAQSAAGSILKYDERTVIQPAFAGGSAATIPSYGSAFVPSLALNNSLIAKSWFPIFKDDPDVEADSTTDATISNNDMVIGFFGKEFEIDKDYTRLVNMASISIGSGLGIATNSRLCLVTQGSFNGNIATVAVVLATQNGVIRCRLLN